MADAAGQHTIPQHGVNHRALSIAGPIGTAASESDDAINIEKATKKITSRINNKCFLNWFE